MEEFSLPAVATIGDTTTLTDPVWTNAERFPDAVQFLRHPDATWTPVTCAEFRTDVPALARG